jgi:tripartite-type tricarboxylate transporter receptor subunit TctC
MRHSTSRRCAVSGLLAIPTLLTAAGLAGGGVRPARAQAHPDNGWTPTRPIRIIVPFPPGQANDILTRLIADKAAELRWSQYRAVVENRAGGGGTIGMQAAAQAAPDGHTLVFGSLATFAINPAIMRNIPYDVERDFAPVIRVFEGALLLVVPARGPDVDLAALVRRLRGVGREGLTYASSGPGSTQHMAAELFLQGIGARATHVPLYVTGSSADAISAGLRGKR